MLLVQSERNALLASLTAVVGVVERRHTLPILSNLLLEKKGSKLTLLATDLELQVSTQLDVQAGEDFAITIAARKLFDIVRALPDSAKLKLDSKDSQVVVSAGKSRFTLQTLPAADFPRVETGAGLGEAIRYTQKRWDRLTRFLEVPGVPLDNSAAERILKKAILSRKNSYFYKTARGAHVGDMFMSLIHTAELMNGNPFEYLTELQKHVNKVRDNPSQWMPWNYRETMKG